MRQLHDYFCNERIMSKQYLSNTLLHTVLRAETIASICFQMLQLLHNTNNSFRCLLYITQKLLKADRYCHCFSQFKISLHFLSNLQKVTQCYPPLSYQNDVGIQQSLQLPPFQGFNWVLEITDSAVSSIVCFPYI